MKDYRPYSREAIKYGIAGIFLYIGPVAYYLYRLNYGKRVKNEPFHFVGSWFGSIVYAIFGLLLWTLESIKFYILD